MRGRAKNELIRRSECILFLYMVVSLSIQFCCSNFIDDVSGAVSVPERPNITHVYSWLDDEQDQPQPVIYVEWTVSNKRGSDSIYVIYTVSVSSLSQYTRLIMITLSISNGFSKFFHCWKDKKISNKVLPSIPLVYFYTTLRKKFEFVVISKKTI